MAAMMPSSATASANPYEHYDNDALEQDLIDPDDGTHAPTRKSPPNPPH